MGIVGKQRVVAGPDGVGGEGVLHDSVEIGVAAAQEDVRGRGRTATSFRTPERGRRAS